MLVSLLPLGGGVSITVWGKGRACVARLVPQLSKQNVATCMVRKGSKDKASVTKPKDAKPASRSLKAILTSTSQPPRMTKGYMKRVERRGVLMSTFQVPLF